MAGGSWMTCPLQCKALRPFLVWKDLSTVLDVRWEAVWGSDAMVVCASLVGRSLYLTVGSEPVFRLSRLYGSPFPAEVGEPSLQPVARLLGQVLPRNGSELNVLG
eukprot:4537837-Prorocentrum_lima.AAC.1